MVVSFSAGRVAGPACNNLDILRHYLPDAAVDLVYLDPPRFC